MTVATTLRENTGIKVDAALRKEFPSVFNHVPDSKLSERYELYRSDVLIDSFADKGLKLVEISQQVSRARNPNTQMHSMRFQSEDAPAVFGVNDSVPEIVVLNSHNGRNKFSAFAGIFRFVCANGLVVADMNLGAVVRRHFGEANRFDKVSAIVNELPEAITKMSGRIIDWTAMTLDEKQQVKLAAQLIKARGAPSWVEPQLVLEARRPTEAPVEGQRDLWTTFNVLQENLTNATVLGSETDERIALRPLRGAFRNFDANRSLWATAEAYYNAKVEGMDNKERDELKRLRRAVYDKTRVAGKKLVAEPADA